MPSLRETNYRTFLEALLKGETARAQQLIVPGFRASFGETMPDMAFAELLREIRRQRAAFPDLGRKIKVMNVSEDTTENRLVITYKMTMTFSGVLTSADGRHRVQPTGEVIEVPSQDRVQFEGNKIRSIEVVTDMGHTMAQMFRQ
jgi:hypothetical protein